jgi:hypothetical protein
VKYGIKAEQQVAGRLKRWGVVRRDHSQRLKGSRHPDRLWTFAGEYYAVEIKASTGWPQLDAETWNRHLKDSAERGAVPALALSAFGGREIFLALPLETFVRVVLDAGRSKTKAQGSERGAGGSPPTD